jgi:hypothetical protein
MVPRPRATRARGAGDNVRTMNASWGWILAALAVAVGWHQWGWQGVVLAVTVTVFWLLLQFNRAVRVMRQASGAPVGHVASAVMLHSRLREGMRLLEIIPLTRSLGQRLDDPASADAALERFVWSDASGASVRVELSRGRLRAWTLERPSAEGDA